jgi:hypothetical protein
MATQQIFNPQPQSAFDLGEPEQNGIEFPLSLAERYQPRRLDGFVGLERPKLLLANLIAKPRPCALLFVGPPGAGKSAMAMTFAEQLPGSLHHVSAQKCDVASLDALNDKLAYCPPIGRFWVVLVDEADQMTEKAQLQLLSKLDGTAALRPIYGGGFERGEPAPIIWIFTCNGRGEKGIELPSSLTPRFRSRCMEIPFLAVSQAELALYLEQIWKLEGGMPCELNYFAYMAAGVGVRDALMRLESDLLSGPRAIPVPEPARPAPLTFQSAAVTEFLATLESKLGKQPAAVLLQKACRAAGQRLYVDGKIGHVTIKAVNRVPEAEFLAALQAQAKA